MTHVYTHPGQPQMQVEVILASKGPQQKPVYTIRMRYPRPIHGEILTHRVFGRNARSSRAVPVRTMLLETSTIPYIPWHWLKNKPGMQGTEPLSETEQEQAISVWLKARDAAVESVKELFDPDELNIHKQNPNRLLEPFSWIDTLITSTEWDNFLWLRDHEDAEPHLRDLARLVKQAIDETEVQPLEPGQWHLPYIHLADVEYANDEFAEGVEDHTEYNTLLCKLSSARCARISYKPFNGDASYEKELGRYNMLVSSDRVHASPLEHQATPDTKSWQETVRIEGNVTTALKAGNNWDSPHLHGNLTGYVQFRKTIPNENHS